MKLRSRNWRRQSRPVTQPRARARWAQRLGTITVDMFELRPYQHGALNALEDYWRAGGGNPLSLATATGKSLVIAWLIRDLLPATHLQSLSLVHVQELIEQDVKHLLGLWPEAPLGINCAAFGRRDWDQQVCLLRSSRSFGRPRSVPAIWSSSTSAILSPTRATACTASCSRRCARPYPICELRADRDASGSTAAGSTRARARFSTRSSSITASAKASATAGCRRCLQGDTDQHRCGDVGRRGEFMLASSGVADTSAIVKAPAMKSSHSAPIGGPGWSFAPASATRHVRDALRRGVLSRGCVRRDAAGRARAIIGAFGPVRSALVKSWCSRPVSMCPASTCW